METPEKLTTRIGKLLSGTRKPDEGFATVFTYEPKDFLEKQHGSLYFVIEVASGSKSAAQVGEAVINSIKEEFYSDLDRSVVLSLESALRKANEELLDITSSGETDWVGKLNVACAVISEGKLHLSKVGTIEAYILRGEKITHISEGLEVVEDEKDQHPLRTFSTITSGVIQKSDKLMLSSSDLFYHISLAGLKKLITENSPSGVILKLKDLLKDEEGIGDICFLVVEVTTEEELSKERGGHEVDEIWIQEPKPTETVAGFLGSAASGIGNFFKKTGSTRKIKETPPEPEGETAITEDAKKSAESAKDAKKGESFIQFVANYFKNFSPDKFLKDIKRVFGNLGKSFKERMRSTYFKLFIIVVILFILSLALIIRNYSSLKTTKEVKAKLDQAITLEGKAESALVYEARKEAREYLSESKALAAEVLKTKYYNKEALELLSKISGISKKADGIYEIKPSVVLEFDKGQEASTLTYSDKNLYFVNPKNKKLTSYNILNKEQASHETPSPQSEFVQITSFPKKGLVLFYNDSPEVFEFNIKGKKVAKATSKKGFKKAAALTTYSVNFYMLSPSENQIYRYTKTDSGFANPSAYITDKQVNIKDAVSFTIPGIVYVLKNDGQIVKLIKGVNQGFSLKDMPFGLKKPIKIQSSEGSSEIYILDKELGVLVFSVNGSYIKNFTSPDFKDAKDFYVDEASGTIYVLAGNKILSFSKNEK